VTNKRPIRLPEDFFKRQGSPPVPPGLQPNVPLIGQTPQDFFRCPICDGDIVYIPCGRILRFNPVAADQIQIQSQFPPTESFLYCLGDCRKAWQLRELAAIILEKRKTAQEGEKTNEGMEKPDSP